MNNFLLDSHIFLWLLQEPHKIGKETTKHLTSGDSSIYISAATIWELGLKHQKGKLKFNPDQLLEAVHVTGIKLLPIAIQHITTTYKLNIIHKDPFDCLLLAQAKYESIVLLTADQAILRLNLPYVVDATNNNTSNPT
jgi:PIN domain nuclease of toxin-antitoxin system